MLNKLFIKIYVHIWSHLNNVGRNLQKNCKKKSKANFQETKPCAKISGMFPTYKKLADYHKGTKVHTCFWSLFGKEKEVPFS
jgi:hypothetical protein